MSAYAKSNRAACKQCKAKIDKDAVRFGFSQEVPEGAGRAGCGRAECASTRRKQSELLARKSRSVLLFRAAFLEQEQAVESYPYIVDINI